MAAYLKNLVWSVQGTKHLGSLLGPETISGPAAMAEKQKTEDRSAAAKMLAFRRRCVGLSPHAIAARDLAATGFPS